MTRCQWDKWFSWSISFYFNRSLHNYTLSQVTAFTTFCVISRKLHTSVPKLHPFTRIKQEANRSKRSPKYYSPYTDLTGNLIYLFNFYSGVNKRSNMVRDLTTPYLKSWKKDCIIHNFGKKNFKILIECCLCMAWY